MMEGCSQVVLIIFLQKGTVNDTEDVILIVVPVFIHKLGGDGFQLLRKAMFG